jgi:hypothetical protein
MMGDVIRDQIVCSEGVPGDNAMKMSLEERRTVVKQEKEKENRHLTSVGIAINMYHEALGSKECVELNSLVILCQLWI